MLLLRKLCHGRTPSRSRRTPRSMRPSLPPSRHGAIVCSTGLSIPIGGRRCAGGPRRASGSRASRGRAAAFYALTRRHPPPRRGRRWVPSLHRIGRVVMLGPPNRGSQEPTRWLRRRFLAALYRRVTVRRVRAGHGAARYRWSTPPLPFEAGVIAGSRSVNPVLSLSSMVPTTAR